MNPSIATDGLGPKVSRKQFGLGLLASGLGAALAASPDLVVAQDSKQVTSVATTPSAAGQETYFFKNSAFEFVLLSTLGRAYFLGGNVGKVLWVIKHIEDGNHQSAYDALVAAGDESRGFAEDSLSRGHRESARQACLWATNFYDSAVYFADGVGDPTRAAKTWQMMDDCWLKAIGLFRPVIEQVSIPYEGKMRRRG